MERKVALTSLDLPNESPVQVRPVSQRLLAQIELGSTDSDALAERLCGWGRWVLAWPVNDTSSVSRSRADASHGYGSYFQRLAVASMRVFARMMSAAVGALCLATSWLVLSSSAYSAPANAKQLPAADERVRVVIRRMSPVDARGDLKPAYHVRHRHGDATCAKPSAMTGTAYVCSTPESTTESYDPCWVASTSVHAFCQPKPWSREVVELRVDGGCDEAGHFAAVDQPWGLKLQSDGRHCLRSPADVRRAGRTRGALPVPSPRCVGRPESDEPIHLVGHRYAVHVVTRVWRIDHPAVPQVHADVVDRRTDQDEVTG